MGQFFLVVNPSAVEVEFVYNKQNVGNMQTLMLVCKARAIVGGRGTFTGRYKPAPPGGHGEIHAEVWDGGEFVLVPIQRTDLGAPAFRGLDLLEVREFTD